MPEVVIQWLKPYRHIGWSTWAEMMGQQRNAFSICLLGLLITAYWGKGHYYGKYPKS